MSYKYAKEREEKSISEKKDKVDNDHWRQKYHIQGIVGLINDPNGFSQFKDCIKKIIFPCEKKSLREFDNK